VSLNGGFTRRAQCVPCGAYHEPVIGPGWKSPRWGDPAAEHPDYRRESTALSLTRTGATAKGGIVGILRSPDGDFKMTATPEGWAQLERDVAAGHNPVVIEIADNAEEVNS
jgi:hypothetical protein